MAKTINLNKNERVIAVVPETCSGPGWVNQVVWVYILDDGDKTIRIDAIQPDECTRELSLLAAIGELVHKGLIAAVPVKRTNKE